MALTDSICLTVYVWLFWANSGPILAQLSPKMGKYDPVKPVPKISCIICTQRMKLCEKVVLFTSMLLDKELTLWGKLVNFEGQNLPGMSGNIPSKFFHELSSLIAIGNWPYFCWDSFFDILSVMISLSTCCALQRIINNWSWLVFYALQHLKNQYFNIIGLELKSHCFPVLYSFWVNLLGKNSNLRAFPLF